MRRFILNIFSTLLTVCFLNFASFADETSKETEINVFTGMFDFSDDKQKSGIFGAKKMTRSSSLFMLQYGVGLRKSKHFRFGKNDFPKWIKSKCTSKIRLYDLE